MKIKREQSFGSVINILMIYTTFVILFYNTVFILSLISCLLSLSDHVTLLSFAVKSIFSRAFVLYFTCFNVFSNINQLMPSCQLKIYTKSGTCDRLLCEDSESYLWMFLTALYVDTASYKKNT